jgi:hypothetical protein
MVDGRVVERPRGGHRFFKTQNFGLVDKIWTAGWEGRGVGTWQSGTSKVVAPACVD